MFFGQIQMDTLDAYLIDTVLTSLKILTEQIDQLKHTNDRPNLIPFLSALAGAGLAVGTQLLIKYVDANRDRKRLILDTKILIIELRARLNFQLRDLAYFKQNTEYQYWQSITEKEEGLRHKCTDEHYKSSAKWWECDASIAETISKYIASIRKYHHLKGAKNVDTNSLDSILNFTYSHAAEYPNNGYDFHQNINQDISKLKDDYFKIFVFLDKIESDIF